MTTDDCPCYYATGARAPIPGSARAGRGPVASALRRLRQGWPRRARAVAHPQDPLQRLSALYAARSRTSAAIAAATDRLQLCRELCRICVETGHATTAQVGFVHDQCFQAIAFAGPRAQAERGIDLGTETAPAASPIHSPIATALRQQRTAICAECRNAARLGRAASAIAVPIREGGRVSGALALHIERERYYDAEIVGLVEALAQDLSLALDALSRDDERHRAIVEEQAGHERFQRVFWAMPGYTSITDIDSGAIVDVNAVVCRDYGYAREQMIGRRWVELGVGMTQDDRVRLREALLRQGSVHDFATRIRLAGGEWRDVLIGSESIVFCGRNCMLVTATDMTERRALEAAEAASQAKSQFLSHVSHELRTPLNAMIGFADLMLQDPLEPPSPKQSQRLALIHDAGQHLAGLVDDVLDVGHIEAGRLQVEMRPIELGPLFDATLPLVQTMAQRAGVTVLGPLLAEAQGWVQADPLRLRQILVNLLSNAIKYNRVGGHVAIEVAREGGRLHLSVADNGLGMNAQQVADLFRPYNRVGRERSGIQGCGIGLALSQRLAQLMGGEIRVHSEVGQGTRMTLVLPIASAATRLA